jgi:5-methylcytosine-specific restriction endonuclease McrA
MSKRRPSARQRESVRAKAGERCEYCLSQERFSPDTFSVEHVIPRAKGGDNTAKNLALACQGCNNRKYLATEAVDGVTGEMAPLYHPRRP